MAARYSSHTTNLLIAGTLIVLAILGRLVPHPDNFTPLAAVALLGGAVLPARWALVLPAAAVIISDLIIGLHPLIAFTWGSFIAIALFSHFYLKKITVMGVATASVGASALFYLVSNFGVWLEGKLYAPTWHGLVECYINALPFFKSTLAGDLMFTAVPFGLYALATRAVHWRANHLQTQPK